MALTSVGGLTEVGFSSDERFLLIVSWQGRGLIDTLSGDRVARDPEEPQADSDWLNERGGTILGIGPVDGVPIRCVGLWGGSLAPRSNNIVVHASPNGAEVCLKDDSSGVTQVLQRPVSEVRAAGFSPSGDVLVIATNSDVEIFRRAG